MEKDADAFRTISEVGDDLDLPQHVLRFWETRFTQIKPIKRGGGRRYYRPDDVDLLRGIKHLLYAEGYTIKGVQRILREESLRFVQAVGREGRMPPTGEQPNADHGLDVAFGDMPDEIEEQAEAQLLPAPRATLNPQRVEPVMSPMAAPVHAPEAAPAPVAPPLRREPPMSAPAWTPFQTQQRQEPVFDPPVSNPHHDEAPATPVSSGPLFGDEPVAPHVAPSRKAKPKQLALFEGMGDEGLNAKDREALRQALERIDECRKILASADLTKLAQTSEF